jgi:hypothetical protein
VLRHFRGLGVLHAQFALLVRFTKRTNAFNWECVELNQRGDPDYRPEAPWILKLRRDKIMAADIHSYDGDSCETAPTAEMAWLASSRVAKTCSWLGLQDAARKRRPPAMETGAWAGSVVHASKTESRSWDKTRRWIRWMSAYAQVSGDDIPHKELESCRGFLVHVAWTYGAMVPYLKGVHHTLDSWRPVLNKLNKPIKL